MDGWGLLQRAAGTRAEAPCDLLHRVPGLPVWNRRPDVVGYMSKAVDRADLYALLPPAIRRSRERGVTTSCSLSEELNRAYSASNQFAPDAIASAPTSIRAKAPL